MSEDRVQVSDRQFGWGGNEFDALYAVGCCVEPGLTASIVTGMTGVTGVTGEEQDIGSGAELGLTVQTISVEAGGSLGEPASGASKGSGKIQSVNQERAGEARLQLQSSGTENI